MDLNPGDVIHIYSLFTSPTPKYKYAICVCDLQKMFFLINTEPRRLTPKAQVLIKVEELPCLKNNSYVDTSKFIRYYPSEINSADKIGKLSDYLKHKIKEAALQNCNLPKNHKKLVKIKFTNQFDQPNNFPIDHT